MKIPLTLEHGKVNTILAALKVYALESQGEPANRADEVHDIACGFGSHADGRQMEDVSLDEEAIEELTQEILTAYAIAQEPVKPTPICNVDGAPCTTGPVCCRTMASPSNIEILGIRDSVQLTRHPDHPARGLTRKEKP